MDIYSLANSFVRLDILELDKVLACVEAQLSLMEQIKAQQFEDGKLCIIRNKVLQVKGKEMVLNTEGGGSKY